MRYLYVSWLCALCSVCDVVVAASGFECPNAEAARPADMLALAKTTLQDFAAGSGYPQVWVRDTATFIEEALVGGAVNASAARSMLLEFFSHQGSNGNVPDGVSLEDGSVFKNTVETDQESSLVLWTLAHVRFTSEYGLLDVILKGTDGLNLSVAKRIERAFGYLYAHSFASEYGLLFGATTIDWGDVQPEKDPGVIFDNNSHPAIDIYDNAMWVLALDAYASLLTGGNRAAKAANFSAAAAALRDKVREHLWDNSCQQFKPHIYLKKGSPFPVDFDEAQVYYHGGTAVAALAQILNDNEVKTALGRMRENVDAAGGKVTLGMTVFPPYPDGFFKNRCCNHSYSYQNAGDWPWFGGRFVQALVQRGMLAEAREELVPMLDRACVHKGFFEWYGQDNEPHGSAKFLGSAGVLGSALRMLDEAQS